MLICIVGFNNSFYEVSKKYYKWRGKYIFEQLYKYFGSFLYNFEKNLII